MQCEMWRDIIKSLVIALAWGVIQTLPYLSVNHELMFSDIILWFGFVDTEIILVYIIDLSLNFLPFFLFQIVFGTYVYRRFCSASVYYFSRCPNRVSWFLKESGKLYFFSFIYPLVMVLTATLLITAIGQFSYDQGAFMLLLYYVVIHSLWLFITALLVNIIAIKLDSSHGFIIIVVVQMASIGLLLLWENVWPLVNTPNQALHVFLLKFNPVARLILPWQSSSIAMVNDKLNQFNIDFNLNESALVFLISALVVIGIGSYIVRRQEWVDSNTESGGL